MYITSDRKPSQTCLNKNENLRVHIFESRYSVFYYFSDLLFVAGFISRPVPYMWWWRWLLASRITVSYRLENLHQKGVTVHMFQLESRVWLSMAQFKSDVHHRSWSLGQLPLKPMDWEKRRVSRKETEDRWKISIFSTNILSLCEQGCYIPYSLDQK